MLFAGGVLKSEDDGFTVEVPEVFNVGDWDWTFDLFETVAGLGVLVTLFKAGDFFVGFFEAKKLNKELCDILMCAEFFRAFCFPSKTGAKMTAKN